MSLPTRNKQDVELAKQEIINNAPVSTNSQQKEPTTSESNGNSNQPWLNGVSITQDELQYITHKTTINLNGDLTLRLNFLAEKKRKPLGPKINKTDLIAEAIDSYTRKELKKLGYDV